MYPLMEIDFLARVHLLNVFSRGVDPALQEQMKNVTVELETQNTFRNNLVHGPWTGFFRNFDGNGNDAWQKFGLSRRYKPKAFNVMAAEISANAVRLNDLIGQAIRLSRQIVQARAADQKAGRGPGTS